MKTLKIPFVKGFDALADFAASTLNEVPWPELFPYKPSVKLYAAHTADAMLLRFDVEEDDVKAVCLSDNGPVWEDSCVEFFVKVPDSPYYFNFETNCLGVGLAAKRTSRTDCTHFSPDMMGKVIRRSSLASKAAEGGRGAWTLELEVPFDFLDCGARPEVLMANFYKCGDKTAKPHYISWAPIGCPTPDFHRPEYFGKLELQW
ncbi:MAG: hypothetical protein KBS53_02945 [Bacteroidales bacterium]|nr:hypothetical protein [Candidatus Hennigimonas equi]